MTNIAAAILILISSGQTRQDIEFRFAVESFVMATAPETKIPEPYAGMIEGLWSEKQSDRNAASKRIAGSIGRNDRWLFWARRFPRAEIAYRANRILRKIHPCPKCHAIGKCLYFVETDPSRESNYGDKCKQCRRDRWEHSQDNVATCDACDGVGSSWVRGPWE